MSTIHIACAFDKAMSIPALVLAASLKKLAPPDRKTVFHALECERDAFPDYAAYLLNADHFEVRLHRVSTATFKKYDMSMTLIPSVAIYGRLAIPQLIEEADRVLYLDCDVLVMRPVGDLFDTDLQGFPLAACRDLTYLVFTSRSNMPARRSVEALVRNPSDYFNSGVLLIDCVKWRAANYLGKIHALLSRPPVPLFFGDQDALNAVFQENYLQLDPRWNTWAVPGAFAEAEGDLAQVADLCARDPWIFHFVGPAKPWIRRHKISALHGQYWRAASETPFFPQLVDLYRSGESIAYAQPRFPLISANKRVAEFVCTVSRIAGQLENRLALKRSLSAKLFAIGNKIYNNSHGAERDA